MRVGKKQKSNIFFFLIVFFLVNVFFRGPDLFKLITKPENKWYSGQASWFDPWDVNVYTGLIGLGKRDGLLFKDLFDSDNNQRNLNMVIYTFLGKLSSPFNLSNQLVFHLAGLAASIFLIAVLWWLINFFLKKENEKKLALVFLLFGGGLGWLLLPLVALPDLASPNFTLAKALRAPHEAISISLLLVSLIIFKQWFTLKKNSQLFKGFLIGLLAVYFHPYSLVTLLAILFSFGLYQSWKNQSFEYFKPFLLLIAAAAVYFLLIIKDLSVGWSYFNFFIQHSPPSPSPVEVILGWGVLFPFLILAFFLKDLEDKNNSLAYLKIWLIIQWLTIYLPFSSALLIRGLIFPVSILASRGAGEIYQRMKPQRKWFLFTIIFLASISSIYQATSRFFIPVTSRWMYLAQDEGKIFDYLKQHGQNDEVVLASYPVANHIPAHTPKRVWIGHHFNPLFKEKMALVEKFYRGEMTESEVDEFINKNKIIWIFWGPDEKKIGTLDTFPCSNSVELTIENQTASLYRVKE